MATLVELCYFAAAVLFILGLKRMSHPRTARSGIVWAGIGMLVATIATFLYPDLHNYLLMFVAIAIGGGAAWWSGKRVAMTDMPQMIAIYNGMGGGAAGAIAAVELLKVSAAEAGAVHDTSIVLLAVLGAMIGTVSFSGSCIAFAKLQGLMKSTLRLPHHQLLNLGLFALLALLGLILVFGHPGSILVMVFFMIALAVGVIMTLPIGGADMPVVISMYNAFTGLAVAFEGFVLGNAAMIIAGTVVGAAGSLLTRLMAKAMNRPLTNVLFSSFGATADSESSAIEGRMKEMSPADAAAQMIFAGKVIVVPGYGMAVAQAQHKIWEVCQLLMEQGIEVKFAIHPVAGRMPGHMNVLLAEAGVPYELIFDMEEINNEFATAGVSLVIGANDVVNPAARHDKSSPIYGMPILNVDKSRDVLVIKRGKGTGFSGVENTLFYGDNCHMVYGDGQKVAQELIAAIKQL
jgi:NAD(P) transhydrogenase subunit beta